MLVFDEKEYAIDILNNKKYNTTKTQGRERCILVRYLTYLGYDNDYIKEVLNKIPIAGGEFLSDKDKDLIFEKIIAKANKYDFIFDISVDIYEEELDTIMTIEDLHARHLLFILLVYYKWAVKVNYLQFYSKKNDIIMVIENNNDLWKIAGLSKLRVADRYRLCNLLYNKGFYRIDNFKAHNYIYLPFVREEGNIVITINRYNNILGEMLLYENPKEYKRCVVCGTVIKKTRSPKKYCTDCAHKENIRKTKENKKSLKSKRL